MQITNMIFICFSMFFAGCSAISYNASKEELLKSRAYASGNKSVIRQIQAGVPAETAIRAVALNDGGVGIGVDLSALSIIAQHPLRQLGAAVLDAGALYGAYSGVQSLNDSSSDNSTATAGRDQNTVSIEGDGNSVNIGNTSTTTTGAE